MANENPTPAEQKIIDLLTKIAGPATDGEKAKESKSDEKRSRKRHLKAIRDNGLALVGLSTGMLSLSKIVGDQLNANKTLAESLGKVGKASEGVTAVSERFITGQQGFEQKVKMFADAVEMGMTKFSDDTLRFGMQLKILGVQNKTSFRLMRANTQGLGIAEEASLMLADQLVSTAVRNKDSISGLIDAINGMKDAMIGTTVELGPKAALNAQKIAAMMSQGNSELQESSAKFVKSFLSGSDGYMKAAKMGVQFTGQESTAEMARKFETILEKMSMLQSGKQGAGSQFLFDALERSFGLSREDFNLQTQIGTSINALAESNTEQISQASARINMQQQMLNALDGIQTTLQGLLQTIATVASGFIETINQEFNKFMVNPTQYLKDTKEAFEKNFPKTVFWLRTIAIALTAGAIVKGMQGLASLAPKMKSFFGPAKQGRNALGRFTGKTTGGFFSRFGKSLGKLGKVVGGVAKKIPVLGAVVGTGFAINSALQGNWADAGVHLASGALSTIPGVGTIAATALEAGYHLTGAREAIMGTSPKEDKIAANGEESAATLAEISGTLQETLVYMKDSAPPTQFKLQ